MSLANKDDNIIPTPSVSQCLARALYDNIADSPDELAFRRGDVLTVLEQNTGGCDGWWLCSLRGRQGICPGNRLRIIPGAFDTTAAHRPRRSRAASTTNIPASPTPIYMKLEESVLYDIPGPPQPISRISEEFTYDTPRPSTTSDWYDAPRAARPASADSGTGSAGSYDVPKSRALPLTCDAALDALDRLQEEAQAAVARLLSYVKPGWRKRSALSPHVTDLRVAGTRLRSSLHDLVVFADATLMNATEAQDKGLAPKLRPVVKALRDAERISHEATTALDAGDWNATRLERDEEPPGGGCDALDQLVVCARGLTEDVRRITSLVHGNAKLLFKGSLSSEWTEYCDYVRLESRDVVNRQRAEIRATLPHKLKGPYDPLLRDSDASTRTNMSTSVFAASLPPDDRALASFYASHTATHEMYLKESVDSFLQTVALGEAPQSFLAQGKFVVLGAHRMIRVGDAVHRAAKDTSFAVEALKKTDALAEALAATVSSCRGAAERWPCAAAVAEMKRCARALIERANQLRQLLLKASTEELPLSNMLCPG